MRISRLIAGSRQQSKRRASSWSSTDLRSVQNTAAHTRDVPGNTAQHTWQINEVVVHVERQQRLGELAQKVLEH